MTNTSIPSMCARIATDKGVSLWGSAGPHDTKSRTKFLGSLLVGASTLSESQFRGASFVSTITTSSTNNGIQGDNNHNTPTQHNRFGDCDSVAYTGDGVLQRGLALRYGVPPSSSSRSPFTGHAINSGKLPLQWCSMDYDHKHFNGKPTT